MASQRNILYLFDVDGTLTKPRQVITRDMIELLENIRSRVKIGLVSGSDYPKIVEQMGGEENTNKLDYVFSENGLMQYRQGELISTESIINYIGEETLQRVINFCLGYMSQITLPAKRGNFIEFRTSMINVCPVGRSCSQAERDAFAVYDEKHKIREKLVQALKNEFPEIKLEYAVGGQISVDVFPTGWDKTYCLKHVIDEKLSEIHFFGDKTLPGGNDHEIFNHDSTIGHTVTSPSDTKTQILKILDLD